MKRGDLVRVTGIQPEEVLDKYEPYAVYVERGVVQFLCSRDLEYHVDTYWYIDSWEDAHDDPEALRLLAVWAMDGNTLGGPYG